MPSAAPGLLQHGAQGRQVAVPPSAETALGRPPHLVQVVTLL
jgi:hypothetical protein